MTIYSPIGHRKIYEQHFGPIPKDANGRSYEIHHIDGNHHNNDPSNLQCVTIQEHYDIHYSQGDWAACHRMSARMQLTPSEISNLSKKSNQHRIDCGTHHFLGGAIQKSRVDAGTHPFVGPGAPSQQMWVCPHCGKTGKSKSNYTRWHGEKCPSKNS